MPIEQWHKTDTSRPVPLTRMAGTLFGKDADANLIGFRLHENGTDAPLSSGTPVGYVTKPDGEVIEITGALRDGMPYIILPASCYEEVGEIEVIVKVNDMTVGAVIGTVARTETENTVE